MRRFPEASAALIIPALNEEPIIGKMLAGIPPSLFHLIIVADNGSTDRTAEIARAAGATVVTILERGYGAACLSALDAIPNGIGAVVFMQADCSENPEEARELLCPIYEGRADLVLGSRTLGSADKGALLAHQQLGNRLLIAMIHLFFGHRYTDLGPFRAIRIESLKALSMRDRNYGWTVEMQVRALQRGLRILEVPVSYRVRVAGENKVSGNLKASVKAGLKMIRIVLKLRFGN